MTLKRFKSTYVIKEIGKKCSTRISRFTEKNKFSIIIDETTDVSTAKTCAVVVKYFYIDSECIQTRLLDLFDIYSHSNNEIEESTGQHLFDIILKLLEKREIPLENLIGFAADGASNIMGQHNSLTSRLQAAAPGITIFKCACHSIHLCAET